MKLLRPFIPLVMLVAGVSHAADDPAAGRVSYLSGTMYVQTPDNKTRILARNSSIYGGRRKIKSIAI